jgi:PAS domain S-box-containing protein
MKFVSQPRNQSATLSPGEPVRSAVRGSPATSDPAHWESEWRSLVYELAPLPYLNFDSGGRIVDFNIAASRLLGLSRQQDLDQPLAEFINPRHRRRLMGHIRRSLTSAAPVVTRFELRAGNGSTARREIEMSTRPASEALCYRTQLRPLSGAGPAVWPDGDPKFRALVENSSEVICICAPDGTVFYITPVVRRILGYEPSSWFGRNGFEIIHPDHAESTRTALRRVASSPTGSTLSLVIQVRHSNGTWRWIEAVLTNLIGQPAIGGIVCNLRDITDSRIAEEALRSSEQRYRMLAESLPQLITIRDADGHIEYCNSRWCEYRGIDGAGSIIVHDWRIGIPEEDIAALRAPPWQDGIPRPWEAECRIPRASDGTLRWHTVRVIPLEKAPGARDRWLVIAHDIHERKQVEQERERLLRQIERERSELAVQYAVVRVLAWASSLTAAAPHLLAAFCDQLGWQAGALWTVNSRDAGGSALSLVHIRQHPELTPPGSLRLSQPTLLRKGQSLAGRVWAEKKPLHLSSLPTHRGAFHHRTAAVLGLRNAFAFPIVLGGEVRGVVELFTREKFEPGSRLLDIVSTVGIQIGLFMERTHTLDRLHQSEEALIEANNALEQRVRERTAELHAANRELSAEIAERTRLEREIISISEREQRRIGQDLHDGVCQELAAIAFMSRALAKRMDAGGGGEIERINEMAGLLNGSISRCRDIARGLHPVELDADGLMVALDDLASRTSQAIPCTFRCAEPILMPESDVALNLYRIAQEAVNNALKYSGAGAITISLGREGAALRLSISDDGCGIPTPVARPRRNPRGGMGLHIMRYRARTMGATLRVLNRRPHGAEIICLLPRTEGERGALCI